MTLLKVSSFSKMMLIAPPGFQGSLNTAGPSWHLMTEKHKEWLKNVPHSYTLEQAKEIPHQITVVQ